MPYIKEERRPYLETNTLELASLLKNMGIGTPENGDVVYVLYLLMKELYSHGNFDTKSDALKVLECAKMEYYRRIMASYEDEKIIENGDVE